MSYRKCPSEFFRLFISHDVDGLPLAVELREQLRDYGIAAFVGHEHSPAGPSATERTQIQAALQEMDGLIALVTRRFQTSAWCNQELGFALGKGGHVQCIELSGAAPALAATSPHLGMPTDFDLAMLISRFVARDPLVSERLRPAAVQLIVQRQGESLARGLRFLENFSWPGEGGAAQLIEARARLSRQIPPEAARRLDRLIEHWQDAASEDQTGATIRLRLERNASAQPIRTFVPLVGPI